MKIYDALKYLKCPYCTNQKLLLNSQKELFCEKCSKTFKTVNEIPILIDSNLLGEQEKKQIEFFEKHYAKFSDKKYRLENWRLSVLKRIFNTTFNKKIKTYLDIGCGATGYTTIEAVKKNKLISFGIDISLEAMLKAKILAEKEGVEDKTFFLVCSAENLPFRPNTFDYISAVSLLEHLDDDRRAIKNISEIIKTNGYLYICVPNTYKRMWFFLWPVYYVIDKIIGHKRHYSIEKLDQVMQKAGFKRNDFFYNGHLIKLLQLFLEKLSLIEDKTWWKMEKNDINTNPISLQLNALYKKNEENNNSF